MTKVRKPEERHENSTNSLKSQETANMQIRRQKVWQKHARNYRHKNDINSQ